jgi:hypothetical protein
VDFGNVAQLSNSNKQVGIKSFGGIGTRRHVCSQQEWHCLPR